MKYQMWYVTMPHYDFIPKSNFIFSEPAMSAIKFTFLFGVFDWQTQPRDWNCTMDCLKPKITVLTVSFRFTVKHYSRIRQKVATLELVSLLMIDCLDLWKFRNATRRVLLSQTLLRSLLDESWPVDMAFLLISENISLERTAKVRKMMINYVTWVVVHLLEPFSTYQLKKRKPKLLSF